MSVRTLRVAAWLAAGAASTLLFGAVAQALLAVARQPAGLTELVRLHLPDSGVAHPVTAVLLNFRSYDTWLEVLVLLAAAVGMVVLRADDRLEVPAEPAGPVVRGLAEALLPVTVVVGIFVLSLGIHSPGGAFQGGAVLAAGLVMLRLGGYRSVSGTSPSLLWAGLAAATVAFVVVAALPLLAGGHLLALPAWRAPGTIVVVELAVTVSVALTLAFLFVAAPPNRR